MLNILDTNADDTSYGDKHDEAQPGEEEEQKEDGDGLTPKSEFRVKVLQAKDQSAWETLGVGCVDYSIVQKAEDPRIVVKSEDDGDLIIDKPIVDCFKYSVEQESILTWSERDELFYALSFQNVTNCGQIRDLIQKYLIRCRGIDTTEIERILDAESLTKEDFTAITNILDKISDQCFGDQLCIDLITNNFISKALKSCKNLEDEDDRVKVKADIRDIFKTFFSLGGSSFLDELLDGKNYSDLLEVIGGCDRPDCKNTIDKLSDTKKSLDIESVGDAIDVVMHVLKLEDLYIHLFNSDSSQKATPSYIKDSIGYEEDKLRVLMLTSHPFLNDVVDTLFSSVESEPKFQACVELMDIISREMPKFTITNNLASTMVGYVGKDDGIGVVHRTMKFLVKYLSTRDTKLRRLVADVTRNLISEKLETVQSLYLVDSQIDGNYDIISALMGQFFVEQDAVIRYILSDAILNIASFGTHKDITSPEVASRVVYSEITMQKFACLYYKLYFPKLYSIFTSPELKETLNSNNEFTLDEHTEFVVNFLCELVVITTEQETYAGMCAIHFFLGNADIIDALVSLLRCQKLYIRTVGFLALKALVLAEAYISHKKVLPENVICAILDAFEKTVESKNVLYSACLDLFDFARKRNIVSLVDQFSREIEKKYPHLKTIGVISMLVLRNKQNEYNPAQHTEPDEYENTDIPGYRSGHTRDAFQYDKSTDIIDPLEEEYFNSCDDDDLEKYEPVCDTNLFSGNFDDDIFYIKDGLNTCWNNTKLPDDKSSGEKVFDRREEKGDGVELDHEELIHENLDDNESEHKEPNSSRPGDISNNDRAIPKKGRKLAEFSPPNDVVVQEVLVTPELGGEDATSCKRTRISE